MRCSLLWDRGRKTLVCPRKLEIKGSVAELSQKHLQRMKDYQVRVVQEERLRRLCQRKQRCALVGLGSNTRQPRTVEEVKTTVSFWFSTLDRHHDDNGLENGET